MLSARPPINKVAHQESLLARKLQKLEEMLEMTENLFRDGTSDSQDASREFETRLSACIQDITAMDHEQAIQQAGSQGMSRDEDEALREKVEETLQRLKTANRKLVASVKAQQESIGNKIARLRENKSMIGRYRLNVQESPVLVDSKL